MCEFALRPSKNTKQRTPKHIATPTPTHTSAVVRRYRRYGTPVSHGPGVPVNPRGRRYHPRANSIHRAKPTEGHLRWRKSAVRERAGGVCVFSACATTCAWHMPQARRPALSFLLLLASHVLEGKKRYKYQVKKTSEHTWGECAKASYPAASIASTAIPGESGHEPEEAWQSRPSGVRQRSHRKGVSGMRNSSNESFFHVATYPVCASSTGPQARFMAKR